MLKDNRTEWAARCKSVSALSGALAAAIGMLVAGGWGLDLAALRSLIPGFPEMKANAAVCFVLSGLALALLALRPDRTTWARACAGLAVAIGGLTLAEYVLGRGFGIDQLLATDRAPDGPHPGRIPIAGALNFVLLGLALLAIDLRWAARWPAQWLALTVAAVSFVVAIGYAYEVVSLYRPSTSSPVALHGVIAFLLLSVGLLLARPDRGLVAAAIAPDAGGLLIRRVLPAALLLPPVLGWLRLQGEQAGLYGTESGLALYVTTMVGVLSLLIWSTAATVKRTDAERRSAEVKAAAQLARLGLLSHITRAIGDRHDLHSIFQVVVRSLEDHLPIDLGCVLLHDAAAGTLIVDAVGARGAALAEELALSEHTRLAIDGNALARCLRGELVHEPDLGAVALPFAQRLARAGLSSLVLAPLVVEGSVIGLLASARSTPHSFSSADCEFLQQLSEQVALATHQARLHGALQRAYDELRQSQQAVMQQERLRALGQMASGIAHDINNAISPVVLYADQLMERESGLSTRGRQALANISRAIDDVAATLARMRDFYREREGVLAMAPMDLNGLVQQVVELTRARWSDMPQQRGVVIRMHTELAADLPAATGAESEVRDALINLVFNAVDAMPDGGTLTLRSRAAPDGGTQLEVADTGAGMDDDTRRRCLEPFFTTKGERGTGLGLAMVYGMLERHGGDIDIRSAPGQGTTVALHFPVAQTSTSAAPSDTPDRRAPRMRILLVDDDPVLLMTLQAMLETDGHVVVAASAGQDGIDTFKAELGRGARFSAVLTDLGMPYVDGRQVARAVKQLSPSTPVILLTGWGHGLDADAHGPEHVDEVLSKPPKLRDLRQVLLRHGGGDAVAAAV